MDITIIENSILPKYIQIVNAIILNISKGNLKIDDQMPSINRFSKEHEVSRDTVEKAYKVLKSKKVIIAKKGKGTYVNSTKLISKINVIFFINELSTYKLEIYNSFVKKIGNKYHSDFEIYHGNELLFLDLLKKNLNKYDYYIIVPHFNSKNNIKINFSEKFADTIKGVPKEKFVFLDNNELNIKGDIIEISQNFECDIYNALKVGQKKIAKYQRIILTTPINTNYSYLIKIVKGLQRFCEEEFFSFLILNKIPDDIIINKHDLFVVIEDDDLVKLMDLITINEYVLGRDVGVLSYNETPLKRLLNIAVVSTNFEKMGETAATMIKQNKKGKVNNPFSFIDRNSL